MKLALNRPSSQPRIAGAVQPAGLTGISPWYTKVTAACGVTGRMAVPCRQRAPWEPDRSRRGGLLPTIQPPSK